MDMSEPNTDFRRPVDPHFHLLSGIYFLCPQNITREVDYGYKVWVPGTYITLAIVI